jgi:hypothetical protein
MANNRQVLPFSSTHGVAPKPNYTSYVPSSFFKKAGDSNDYNKPGKIFGSYLAGLFEGDGHIWIQNQKGSKTHNPRFCITFGLKNEALAKNLLEIIGSGFIRYRPKDNACVLVVSPVVGLKKIVNLINGELRTPALWRGVPFVRDKLSNSGDALKLLVLSLLWKYMGGWTNYSETVTSQKMIENEMGYRGSKSIAGLNIPQAKNKPVIVKEQRVDGSYIERWSKKNNISMLRCTLMGFERNYQVKTLSKQINKVRFSSTLTDIKAESTLNPWFLTGFSDGEACFIINIYKSNKHEAGWGARAAFQLGLHKKDLPILSSIKDYFGVGNISIKAANSCVYSVQAIKDLDVILNHFDKYPLITKKHADYLLFKMAINLIKEKAHLNPEGLRKLVAIRASLNWGLPSPLEAAFPNTMPYPRPDVLNIKIKEPQWLAGFASAEGCFLVRITTSATHRGGHRVILVFKLVQHSRDEDLMRCLIDYLGCGNIYVDGSAVEYRVTKLSDLTDKIIPLFQKYPIQGVKYLDYADFVSVIELMKNGKHLTEEGLDQIRAIKAGMNRMRI